MDNITLTNDEKIYWEKIFNSEFIFETECYKTCNSFCCRWDSEDIPLKIIPKGGTLFYLPKEYAYISQYGKVTENNPFIMKAKLFDKEIYLYYKHCNDDNAGRKNRFSGNIRFLPHSIEIIALLFQEKKPQRAFLLNINFLLKILILQGFYASSSARFLISASCTSDGACS